MLIEADYPVLEFDTDPTAVVEPSSFVEKRFTGDSLIITFFPEVMKKLTESGAIVPEYTIPGENPVHIYKFPDEPDVLITLGCVGCPACAGNLDILRAMGVEKVMFCGGGGVLDSSIGVGRLLLVEGAIRDEGFSYHYVEPSRVIYTDKAVTDRIAAYLDEHNVPYLRGLTWTTDAMLRETRASVERRRSEGAKIVEMEQAGCIAVAQFRGFPYGALIYGGDDCSSGEWNERSWRSRLGIRYDLVMLSKSLLRIM